MKRIAVIGAGISGLSAAYFLSRRHEVSLFERDARLGGHTHTIRVHGDRGPIALDTGFLVHNRRTYPNLVRLFDEIGVETRPSDMSFSVSCPQTGFEYGSRGLGGVFAQPRNLLNPTQYRLLADIIRFNQEAHDALAPNAPAWTLDSFVRDRRYSEAFVSRYLVPMTSAIWSASVERIRAFPMATLARFMANHGMLSLSSPVSWRVVAGGSDSYVAPLIRPLGDRVYLGQAPVSVRRGEGGVTLTMEDGGQRRFDEVVFACHGDQVLRLLSDPTASERAVFSAFETTPNETVLHTDATMLPVSLRARASWNYQLGTGDERPPTVTYHLNRLQGLTERREYCVTLNPHRPIAPAAVIARMVYRHPQMTAAAEASQSQWRTVSAANHTHFCGAYWRYGFHEDGLMSTLRVAEDLGVSW